MAVACLLLTACSKEDTRKVMLLAGTTWTADFENIENVNGWYSSGQYQIDFRKDSCTLSSVFQTVNEDGESMRDGEPFSMAGTHPYTYKDREITIHINNEASAFCFNYDDKAFFLLANDSTITGDVEALGSFYNLVFHRIDRVNPSEE